MVILPGWSQYIRHYWRRAAAWRQFDIASRVWNDPLMIRSVSILITEGSYPRTGAEDDLLWSCGGWLICTWAICPCLHHIPRLTDSAAFPLQFESLLCPSSAVCCSMRKPPLMGDFFCTCEKYGECPWHAFPNLKSPYLFYLWLSPTKLLKFFILLACILEMGLLLDTCSYHLLFSNILTALIHKGALNSLAATSTILVS